MFYCEDLFMRTTSDSQINMHVAEIVCCVKKKKVEHFYVR